MTFNEANVNREADGKFGEKLGGAPEVSIDTIPGDRLEIARAIAKRYSRDGGLYPEFHPDGNIILREQNGTPHYSLRLDEDGLPTEVFVAGERARYDSGAFREAENTANEVLGRPEPSNHERNNRHISLEIDKAGDLFENGKNLNGEPGNPAVKTKQIRVGTGPDGERIYADMRLEYSSKPQRDQNLREVEGRWSFAMSGVEKTSTGAESGGGQIFDAVRESTGRNGIDTARLADLWEKNHLNTLHAGTAIQEMEAKVYRKKNPGADYSAVSPHVHDDLGYKYGSGWLYKEVPADDIAEVVSMLKRGK